MKLAITAAVLCGMLGPALADRPETADDKFRKGKRLLNEKKYADACRTLEDSDKLDPAIGTKLNIGLCYEEWGKLATAWKWYSDAEQMAQRASDGRAAAIRDRLKELDTAVPRLTISLPPGRSATGLTVKLDNVDLPAVQLGTEQRVNPGPHQIDYVVAGVKQTKVIPVERGASSEVTLELPRFGTQLQPDAPSEPAEAAVSSEVGRTRRLIGMGVGGAGALAIGIAGIVVYRANTDYDHAIDNHCNGAKDMCDDIGMSATRNARSRANVATVMTIGGLAAVAGGLYIYLTAPTHAPSNEHALRVSPSFGAAGNGVVLSGAF